MLRGIYSCPSSRRTTEQDQFVLREDVFPAWYVFGNTGGNSGETIALGQIPDPSEKVGMWEAGANGVDSNNYGNLVPSDQWMWFYGTSGALTGIPDEPTYGDCDEPAGKDGGGWQSCNVFPRYRHNAHADFLFLDGHVHALGHYVGTSANYQQYIWIPGLCETWSGTPTPVPPTVARCGNLY